MIRTPVITDHPQRHRRPWISRLALLTAAIITLLIGSGAVPVHGAISQTAIHQTSAARPTPSVDRPTAPAGRLTVAPFGDYVNRLSFDVTSIDPALVTATGPPTLTITGTMTNAGPEGLTDLSYRFQRGFALDSQTEVREELAEPSQPVSHVQTRFTPITNTIAAGATVPVTFTAPITDSQGLAITQPGIYPLMVNINGAVTLEGGPLDARVGELHLLLTVMGVPPRTSTSPPGGPSNPTGGPGDATNPNAAPIPMNFVWPLVDRPHLGVGGVFLDDDLVASVSPGGRLSTLVDGLNSGSAQSLPTGSITIVIDPQLLDELDRMTGPYRVVAPEGDPQPPMSDIMQAAVSAVEASGQQTPPAASTVPTGPTEPTEPPTAPASGTSDTATAQAPEFPPESVPGAIPGSVPLPGTIEGTGQAAAASFLGRLRDLAARYPVVILPYGDADVVALNRAGMSDQVSTTITRGREVAQRVLGTTGTNLDGATAFPINGASDAATLSTLQADGLTTALLSRNSVDLQGPNTGAARISLTGTQVPSAIAQPGVLDDFDALMDTGGRSGWAVRVNALTGVLAQQSFDGTTAPTVLTPDRRWSPDAPGLRALTDLLGTLGANRVITGIPLATLAASAAGSSAVSGTADYPEQAQRQELSKEYLARIRDSRAEVARLRQALGSTRQTNDPNVLFDTLDRALDAAASTAFRIAPSVGDANLSTLEATTEQIRNGIQITSAGNSYTLASSTSPLVLTVQNNLPYNVPVRVAIAGGERVGLTVTDPDMELVPAGQSRQVKIAAEVSRSGQFQVTAHLVGADGSSWGPPVTLSINSNAYGTLTVIIIAVAGGVLVLMVGLRIVQRIRGHSRHGGHSGHSGNGGERAGQDGVAKPTEVVGGDRS